MDSRRGFTLLEMLVALAIGGLVAGSVFQVVAAYARFVEMQRSKEDVQQNVRAALEMIGSELRTVGPGDALVRADRDSITLRVTRMWGVVCAVETGEVLAVIFPAFPGADFGVNLGLGVGKSGDTSGGAGGWEARVSGVGGPEESCRDLPVGEGAVRRSLSLAGAPVISGVDGPLPGDVVSLFETITYRTGSSGGVPGRWIQRRIGDGPGTSNQPFAGPVADREGGLRFEYFSPGASVSLATPIGDPAIRAEVDRVAVVIEAVSLYGRAAGPTSKVDTIAISLRNRVCGSCAMIGGRGQE